ncbi:hypothetical protein D3C86_1303340 [compost metagenome]
MGAGAALEGNLLAFQVFERLQRRILLHEDGRPTGRSLVGADVTQIAAGGLREKRRHIASRANIKRACAKRFEKRRPGGEFRPPDLDAAIFQQRFERALAFRERYHAILLPANPQCGGCGACPPDMRQKRRPGRTCNQSQCSASCEHMDIPRYSILRQ